MYFDGFRKLGSVVLMFAVVGILAGHVAAQTPRSGGTLIYAYPTEPDIWDPQRATAAQTLEILWLLYDTLTIMDWDASTVRPHIAKSWDISPDGLQYTFYLRDDVYFHSGRHMTAEDWVWTFQRLLNPEFASPVAWRLGPVESIEAPGPYTLVIRLREPYSELLTQLTFAFLGVLDREMVERYGDKYGIEYAGGTGPFKWVRWDPGERLVLERNEAYTWGPDIHQNRGPAYLAGLERRVIPERTTMLFQLELGQLDLVELTSDEIPRYENHPRINLVEVAPRPSVEFFGLKTTRPLLQDVRVRRAVSHAINRAEFAETIFYGRALEAKGFVLPETPGYSRRAEELWAYYDPDRARALLDEAGWIPGPDGIRRKDGQPLRLVFLAIATTQNEELALLLQSQLREVGIDLELRLVDGSAFWGMTREDTYDIYYLNYGYTSVFDILNLYFHSRNRPSPNRHGWADPRTDALLDLALRTVDEETRLAYLMEVQDILAENAVWVPLVHLRAFRATSSRVQNLRMHGQYLMSMSKLLDTWLSE